MAPIRGRKAIKPYVQMASYQRLSPRTGFLTGTAGVGNSFIVYYSFYKDKSFLEYSKGAAYWLIFVSEYSRSGEMDQLCRSVRSRLWRITTGVRMVCWGFRYRSFLLTLKPSFTASPKRKLFSCFRSCGRQRNRRRRKNQNSMFQCMILMEMLCYFLLGIYPQAQLLQTIDFIGNLILVNQESILFILW